MWFRGYFSDCLLWISQYLDTIAIFALTSTTTNNRELSVRAGYFIVRTNEHCKKKKLYHSHRKKYCYLKRKKNDFFLLMRFLGNIGARTGNFAAFHFFTGTHRELQQYVYHCQFYLKCRILSTCRNNRIRCVKISSTFILCYRESRK